jgi:hypothetical protein
MELQTYGTKAAIKDKVVGLRVAIGLGVVGVMALLAPVLWAAVSAGIGLIALGVVGAVGVAMFQMLPLLGQKLENRILDMRKAEARRRPIEQIQNSLMERSHRLDLYREVVERIGGRIKARAQAVQDRMDLKSSYDPKRHLEALTVARKAHEQMVQKFHECEEALVKMREKVDDAQFDWEFSEDFMKTKQDIKAASGQDILDGILVDESFKAVRDQYNNVFASLEMDIQSINKTQQLSYENGEVLIDLSDIKVPEMVRK